MSVKNSRYAEMQNALPTAAVEKLIASDSICGPYKRTRPLTLTRRMRFMRWLRAVFNI